ncbi:hypothetical protein QBC37DRAFT_198947 [Rhypophila decipiens]|uniref:N-acetyltransferase ESCO zinc-finger domain-containing protein n=1 Tax=Rhypophila decipiens TaxID=261697 RepID=A0AAN6YLF3_9PEZI|nr:hypothetical protein QBC37DRAFT_198947 [Rhypophila decipiens]
MYENELPAGPTIAFEADRHSSTAPARKRPLRTYGRRTIGAVQDAEPKLASPRSEAATAEQSILSPISKQGEDSDTMVVAVDDFGSPSPRESRESSRPKRNSILSYFKPVSALPPSPCTLLDSARESNDTNKEPPSPPPSPRPTQIPRKRRRLTTRPDIVHNNKADLLAQGPRPPSDEEGEGAPLKENKKRKLQDISPKGAHGAPFIAVTTPPDILLQRNIANKSSSGDSDSDAQEQDLQDGYPLVRASASHLNQLDHNPPRDDEDNDQGGGTRLSSGGAGGCQKNNKKKKPKELVQTTLSLAINPGPGFTVCKDCGILYNHLNENDRKEHKRRHAAHVRSKTKSRGAL